MRHRARERARRTGSQNTYITPDTELLNARANDRYLAYLGQGGGGVEALRRAAAVAGDGALHPAAARECVRAGAARCRAPRGAHAAHGAAQRACTARASTARRKARARRPAAISTSFPRRSRRAATTTSWSKRGKAGTTSAAPMREPYTKFRGARERRRARARLQGSRRHVARAL